MDIPKNILEKNISELFGLDDMSDEEKGELLDSVGSTIMESAALRFVVSNEDDVVGRFEHFIESHTNDEKMIEELAQAFPSFAEILEEEIAAFKSEAVEVLEKK